MKTAAHRRMVTGHKHAYADKQKETHKRRQLEGETQKEIHKKKTVGGRHTKGDTRKETVDTHNV